MKVLYYNELNDSGINAQVKKTVERLTENDFFSADVKKLKGFPYYRAKLNDSDRLLFTFGTYKDNKYILLLEIIKNHDYEKSRFLNGASIDLTRIQALEKIDQVPKDDIRSLIYLNDQNTYFHMLDKIISFDDIQNQVFGFNPPIILIGSAGSGKTVLSLEKLKHLTGDILYVSLSPYLVENARNLYYANQYINEKQNIDFLSFHEFLETIKVPSGSELQYRDFEKWFHRFCQNSSFKNPHQLYEEFNGILTGFDITRACLDLKSYLDLGVRQSIFLADKRIEVYAFFEKYLNYLKNENLYSLNMLSYDYLSLCTSKYDFIVADEVQDLTNIQIQILLKSLKKADNFILCGDANQIVHPNFFSWAAVKSMFYHQKIKSRKKIIRVLDANYRNSHKVTDLANNLLRIKTARFGSVDRESNYLVKCISDKNGEVEFFAAKPKVMGELNTKTCKSARTAVIVMRPEAKKNARQFFKTPLLFAIHEAKGLEYENIVLFNFISENAKEFAEIINGVTPEDLFSDLKYARGKNKKDKSIEIYKFFINALYVAVTRSFKRLYIVESNTNHDIFKLLGLKITKGQIKAKINVSSKKEWNEEARKLELQGKTEQAKEIRENILAQKDVPWEVLTPENLTDLKEKALNPDKYNRQAKKILFEYALLHNIPYLFDALSVLKFKQAQKPIQYQKVIETRYYNAYQQKNYKNLIKLIEMYGIDFRNQFNQTPVMIASYLAKADLIKILKQSGAKVNLTDNWGRTPLQIALRRAYQSKDYAKKHIGKIYADLVSSNIKVKVEGKMIKIDNKLMEFFLLNSMIAKLEDILRSKIKKKLPSFETADFIEALKNFPDHVIPAYRKKRSYLSSVLAKNEVNRDVSYNRKLLVRISLGHYILNPNIEINIQEQWINIYDLIHIKELEKEKSDEKLQYFISFIRDCQER